MSVSKAANQIKTTAQMGKCVLRVKTTAQMGKCVLRVNVSWMQSMRWPVCIPHGF